VRKVLTNVLDCDIVKKKAQGGEMMAHEAYTRYIPGSRFAVVMIHGIVGTPDHFEDLLPVIPESWSVYNILLDGHGGSVADFASTSMEKWKAQVKATVAEVTGRHEKVVLVAHSMGTLFSVQAAIDNPEKIARLFLLNVPVRMKLAPSMAINSVRLALGDQSTHMLQMLCRRCSVKLDNRLWRYLTWIPRFWELMLEGERVRKLLPLLKTPADAFVSMKDEVVQRRTRYDLPAAPNLTVHLLPESGHYFYPSADTALVQTKLAAAFEKTENS
jgi:pimeloyl-ACP methyl ester carboxylesterase